MGKIDSFLDCVWIFARFCYHCIASCVWDMYVSKQREKSAKFQTQPERDHFWTVFDIKKFLRSKFPKLIPIDENIKNNKEVNLRTDFNSWSAAHFKKSANNISPFCAINSLCMTQIKYKKFSPSTYLSWLLWC